jgi:hypothetical protein
MVSPDEAVAKCMRIDQGAFKTVDQSDGAKGYLHRLDGRAPRPPQRPPPDKAPPAPVDPETRHRVYEAMLALLPLWASHRRNLENRGLDADAIARDGYGSLGGPDARWKLCRQLADRFGDEVLLGVPGFVLRKAKKGGKPYVTIAGSPGIVIPVRDHEGRIVGCQVRADDEQPAATDAEQKPEAAPEPQGSSQTDTHPGDPDQSAEQEDGA